MKDSEPLTIGWQDAILPKHNHLVPGPVKKALQIFDETEDDFTLPTVNVEETDKAFQVEVAAPGYKKKDLKVEVGGSILTISAEVEESKKSKDDGITQKEHRYSSFIRTFYIPDSAEKDKISASYKDGMLHITLPKKPGAVAPKSEIAIL